MARLERADGALVQGASRARTGVQSQRRTTTREQFEVAAPPTTRMQCLSPGHVAGRKSGRASAEKCRPRRPKTPLAHDGPHCAGLGRHGVEPTARERRLAQAIPQRRQRTGVRQRTLTRLHLDELHTRACWKWGACALGHAQQHKSNHATCVSYRFGNWLRRVPCHSRVCCSCACTNSGVPNSAPSKTSPCWSGVSKPDAGGGSESTQAS